MKKTVLPLFILLALLLAACRGTAPAPTPTPTPAPTPTPTFIVPTTPATVLSADLRAALDGMVEKVMQEQGLAGITVGIRYGNHPAYVQGYGLANEASGLPASVNTVYEIGAITRQFTAAAIMELDEQGRLGLNDPVSKYFPTLPTAGKDIQIRHLLSHTSGLPPLNPNTGDVNIDPSRKFTPLDSLTLYFNSFTELAADPGAAYRFFDEDYFVLGGVIEKIAGVPYDQYLQQNILKAVGLDSTAYCDPLPQGLAVGYGKDANGKLQTIAPQNILQAYAASGLCSTAGDLLKWQQALEGGKVVTPGSYRQMTTPFTLNDGASAPYGFGLALGTRGGRPAVYHSGGVPGFSALLVYYPQQDLGLALLTNTDGQGQALDALEGALADAVLSGF